VDANDAQKLGKQWAKTGGNGDCNLIVVLQSENRLEMLQSFVLNELRSFLFMSQNRLEMRLRHWELSAWWWPAKWRLGVG